MNLQKLGVEFKVMLGYITGKPARADCLADCRSGWKGLSETLEYDAARFQEWSKTHPGKAYKGEERRKDFEKRKRVAKMTPEEMRKELLTDPLTGLGNKRAYEEDPRLPFQVLVDVDSLKWINDNVSHEAGDELLKTVGWALDSLDYHGYRSYHISGDEFIIQARSLEIAYAAIKYALFCLDRVTSEYVLPDSTTVTRKGVGISYGIAKNIDLAEEALRKHKAVRQVNGLRAARGETPPGMVRGEMKSSRNPLQCAGAWVRRIFRVKGRFGRSIIRDISLQQEIAGSEGRFTTHFETDLAETPAKRRAVMNSLKRPGAGGKGAFRLSTSISPNSNHLIASSDQR